MAVYFNGLNDQETAYLTDAVMRSGRFNRFIFTIRESKLINAVLVELETRQHCIRVNWWLQQVCQ
ncbi:MAG: hypothetical protein IPJ13_14335 [Saprospiraceae bacterium]|nr:hypothetical protein [Saprospiraceae bacterium]